MPEISTLYFIYGLTEDYSEEINQLENEFAEELRLSDLLQVSPYDNIIEFLVKKAQEISS